MKAEEVRALDDSEVTARINELEEERFRLRFRSGTEALDNALRLRGIRRDIARLHTVARERALNIVHTAPKASATKPAAKKASPKKSSKTAAAKKATQASR